MGAKDPEEDMGSLIQSKFGFTPEIPVLSRSEFDLSVTNKPHQEFEGKFVHLYFFKEPPKVNSSRLAGSVAETESYSLVDKVFYLHAPDGIGRSRLVANIEACLGVSATGRNLNTIRKLKEMLQNT